MLSMDVLFEPHTESDAVQFTAQLVARTASAFVGSWSSERLEEAVDAVLDAIRVSGLEPTRLHRIEILDDDAVCVGYQLSPKGPAGNAPCRGCDGRGFFQLLGGPRLCERCQTNGFESI